MDISGLESDETEEEDYGAECIDFITIKQFMRQHGIKEIRNRQKE